MLQRSRSLTCRMSRRTQVERGIVPEGGPRRSATQSWAAPRDGVASPASSTATYVVPELILSGEADEEAIEIDLSATECTSVSVNREASWFPSSSSLC